MSQISDIRNPWRAQLLTEPASFRDIIFHVEIGSRTSGRRGVEHEYPKRNDPYAEDMGRQARRFQFSGYLIYRPGNPLYDYPAQRNRLYEALEYDDVGRLVHPVFVPGGMMVLCERYTMIESREKGGYTQFDMQFVEAGKSVSSTGVGIDTISAVLSNSAAVEKLGIGNPVLSALVQVAGQFTVRQ